MRRAAQLDEIRPGRVSSEPLERVSLMLPAPTKERIEDLAYEQGTTMSCIIRACIHRALRKPKLKR